MHPYLNSALGKGLGSSWTYTGNVHYQLEECNLCKTTTCNAPEYAKHYHDGIWYLDLGTTTRYTAASGNEKMQTYKNPMCFQGKHVVMHLGSISMHDDDQFLVFDRVQVHRVLEELHLGRNSIRVESYAAERRDLSSFRARWCMIPMCGGSPLFHRWLLLPGQDNSKCKAVEHLNDIALDCRAQNLKVAVDLVDNNNTTHRLSRAFRNDDAEFQRCVKRLKESRDDYEMMVLSCPLLPDCVFKAKRVKT